MDRPLRALASSHRPRRARNAFAATCLAAITPAVPAFAGAGGLDPDPTFHVTRIDELLGTTGLSRVDGLNDDGDAVGAALVDGSWQAFVHTYEHGAMLLPPVAGMPNAAAADVADREADGTIVIVGVSGDANLEPFTGTRIATAWRYSTATGALLEAIEIGSVDGLPNSALVAVNPGGLAVGRSWDLGATQPMAWDAATNTLTAFSFPASPADVNAAGDVAGGRFVGDLSGSWTDLGIPAGSTGVGITGINASGRLVATCSMPFTDGAGFFVNGFAAWDGAWSILYAASRFDGGLAINDAGDMVGQAAAGAAQFPVVWIESSGVLRSIAGLVEPAAGFAPGSAACINAHGQVGGGHAAYLLTPLGVMIVAGDVNGDVSVDLSDLCAFLAAPVDLDEDGDADADDEVWLLERLASLGFVPADCNANGTPDTCDIEGGASADCNANGVPDECEADCDGDGVPDACEADCNANGTPDDCDIAAGTSADCNANGIPDECDGAETVEAAHAFEPPATLLSGSVFVHEIEIAEPGAIADVDVTLDIDYRIGDLIVRLVHEGVTVTLVDRPGHPANPLGNGQLGYRIVLDDEGTGPNIENVGNFGSPFEPIESPPAYRPSEALAAFEGLSRAGTWRLEVETVGFSPVNEMLAWSVRATDEGVEVPPCPCPTDVDGDGTTGFNDLVALLSVWGTCGDCAADVNGDGTVGFSDLTTVLAAFGDDC